MADQEMVKGLVRGAWDMHIHSGPDVMPRKFDDIELAQHAMEVGMAGFVMKSHFVGTADRATLIRRMFPQVQAYGGLALNNAIGGLNPIAVDVAGRLGTKVIWLPTTDAANEQANIAGQKDESKLPYWMNIVREMRASGIKSDPITVLDEDGKVTEATRQCLEIIARYDMILATGHVSPQEMVPVVKAAREAKVQRIVITHPEFPSTFLTVDQQRDLTKYDVLFERCFTQPFTGKVEWETVFDNIRRIGPSTTILSTDLGQSTAPYVEEGLATFIGRLLDAGFTHSELETMAHHNAGQVLGALEPATA
jgi:hypothetical protein